MSNNAYLCGTNAPLIYPSMRDGFDPELQIVAAGKYAVPVFWILLFSEQDFADDVVTDMSTTLEDTFDVRTLIAPRADCLRRFEKNCAAVSKHFPSEHFSDHASTFRSEIEAFDYTYMTIEMLEIGSEEDMLGLIDDVYSEIEQETDLSAFARFWGRKPALLSSLCALSGYKPKHGLPPIAINAHEGHRGRPLENHWAMMGSRYYKPIAWDFRARH